MSRISLSIASLVCVLTCAFTIAGPMKVDPVHSSVVFKVRHADVADFYGRFNQVAGGFTIDPSDKSRLEIDVTVQTTSVDTGNKQRDDHLRSADFFNAAQFPTIRFKSKSAEAGGEENVWKVRGDLTMMGVTKEIEVPVKLTGIGERGRFGYRAGISTQFQIKRSEFGQKVDPGVSDEVTLMIALEGARE